MSTTELDRLRDEARYILADIGEPVRGLVPRISKLRFEPGSDKPKSLSDLITCLKQARDCVEHGRSFVPRRVDKKRAQPFPTPEGANWQDLTIRFISDHRVQITVQGVSEPRNYTDMGFQDGRSKNPDTLWKFLRKLAENSGQIENPEQAALYRWSSVESRVQRLRKRLSELFQIPGDPFEPFALGKTYRARFKIECGTSYST